MDGAMLDQGSVISTLKGQEMTVKADEPFAMADRIREVLSLRDPSAPFVSYQGLAAALGLTPPGVIQVVAGALEQTMREDVAAGRPMIAALVTGRAGDMPRRGFFDLAVALGRFPQDPDTHYDAWRAEAAAALALGRS